MIFLLMMVVLTIHCNNFCSAMIMAAVLHVRHGSHSYHLLQLALHRGRGSLPRTGLYWNVYLESCVHPADSSSILHIDGSLTSTSADKTSLLSPVYLLRKGLYEGRPTPKGDATCTESCTIPYEFYMMPYWKPAHVNAIWPYLDPYHETCRLRLQGRPPVSLCKVCLSKLSSVAHTGGTVEDISPASHHSCHAGFLSPTAIQSQTGFLSLSNLQHPFHSVVTSRPQSGIT